MLLIAGKQWLWHYSSWLPWEFLHRSNDISVLLARSCHSMNWAADIPDKGSANTAEVWVYKKTCFLRTINTAYSGFVLEFGASLIRSLASDSDHILNILDVASVWFAQPTCWHAYRVPELAHYSVHTTVSIKQCPQQRIAYNYTF